MTKINKNNKIPQLSDTNGEDNEPKENDKLAVNEENNEDLKKMDSKINGKKSHFERIESGFNAYKNELKSHPYQRIILILAILIFILLLLVIILSVKLGKKSLPPKTSICETSECLTASASVVAALNRTFDPCVDFWKFSCDGWVHKNSIPDNSGSYSVRDEMRNNIDRELRHYIDLIPQGVDEGSADSKVKRFYASCLNVDDIEYSAITTLKYDIQEIGGWSLLSSWSFQNWDKNKVIERLHTKFGVKPYFKVNVGPDDLDPNQPYIIKIEPNGLGLPAKNYYFDAKYEKQVEAYKNFMRELAKLFNAQSIQANQFAESMFNYEKRIAEVSPDAEEYQDPSSYIKKRYSIRELTTIAPSIKWSSLLQSYFPGAQITESTRVLVAFESYFRNISNIISTTDNGAVNDYLMWRFTSTYSPYLSKAFRLIHNEFNRVLNGIDSSKLGSDEHRWEFCIRMTSKLLGQALGSMFIRNKESKRIEQSNAAESVVFNSIKNTILENKNSFIWAKDEEARELIKRKLQQLTLLISQPKFVLKDDINKYYNEFIVQNSFLLNIQHGVHFINKKNEILLKSRNSVTDYSWKLLPQDVDIAYEYADNKLTVPAGILQFPIYDTSLPLSMQFGSLGFQLTAELMRAFDLTGLQYGPPDFRLSTQQTWLSSEAKLDLENRLQCLSSDIQNYYNNMNPNSTLSQTYSDIGALKFAFETYKKRSEQIGENGQLSGVYLNNDQLFYVSFAQSMCESIRPLKSVLSEHRTRLPSEMRVMSVLRQSEGFSKTFCCEKSSQMQSEQSCHLWN